MNDAWQHSQIGLGLSNELIQGTKKKKTKKKTRGQVAGEQPQHRPQGTDQENEEDMISF